MTPYNEKQSSYDAEATKAIAAKPDGLYLIATPVDGATIARAWITQGGPAKFLLNDGMNSPDFIQRRREISQRRLWHVVRHQPDRLDRIFQRELQGVLRRHRSGQSGGRPRLRRRRHRRPRHRGRPDAGSAGDPRRDLQGYSQGRRGHPRRQGRFRQGARSFEGGQADPL